MKTKTNILFYFFLLTFAFILCPLSFILVSCNTTEPHRETLMLEVEDVSCTEVWLKLSGNTNGEFIVERNNKEIKRIALTGTDNIIYDDSLQPSTTYTYQVTSIQHQTTSNQITAVTMDTTSHNFTWQTFTFGGQGGSSTLYDVAIIDENNIWAVGEIYTADDTYNAVHWNGSQWELKKIEINSITYPLRNVYAFSENDILFSNLSVLKWDGSYFNIIKIPDDVYFGQQNSIWGSSNSDFYVVGNNGNIAHYNGNSWEKIESGTELDLYDIYSINGEEIYVSGGNFMNYDGVVIQGSEKKWAVLKEGKRSGNGELFEPYFIGIARTIWSSGKGIYFGGNLLYKHKYGKWELVNSFEGNYPGGNINGEYFGFISQIRGISENDIFLVGEGNTVRHYNGSTWKQIGIEYDYSSNYTWLAVDVKENIVILVGRSKNEAILMELNR